ncbi:MAG: 2,3-bisphosphoglycerate-dependent phosphoglycerate mutase [Thermoleophilaceae bacterium]|nr:2,3-bisphosphoglycerate-dependent phosphoglycerate mutase [Thermoleophilaceae bacterium]
MAETYPQRSFAVPPDATEVILVRHGASAAAVPGEPFEELEGQSDPPLAPEGQLQAQAVAGRLAGSGEQIDGLFVSTLQRTAQTAAPLAALTGLEPVVVPELREVGLGEWEGGELRIRAANRDPLFYEVIEAERWDAIPGAEPAEEFAARVRAGLGKGNESVGPGAVAVAVVHGGVIGELACQATSSRPFAFVHADNCSITRLVVFADGRQLLRSFNDVSHLASSP